jgi:glucose/arabinose dehydrogenase
MVIWPDQMLFIGMGDGGSSSDPRRLATDLSSLHGAILRIDPQPRGDLNYQIPPDNPFLDVEGARPELFAIGLRNPWGFGFDPVTEDLWVVDVGQSSYEEINLVRATGDAAVAGAGVHFGWSAYVFGDYCSGKVWAFDPNTDITVLITELEGVTAVGASVDGEIFVTTPGGTVWRIDPA